jgi:membrane fusion protein (multidrug efflux system)
MTKMPRILVTALAVAGLILAVVYMAGWLSPRVAPGLNEAPDTATEDRFTAREIVVQRIEQVPASIEARDTTMIASRLLARVTSLKVRPGETVAVGQVLATLEQQDLEARLGQAREQLKSLEARLEEARLALARAQDLRERQLVAQAALDQARANYATLDAQRGAAQQAVSEAETALDYAEIRAPISGRVVERFAEPGDTVSPGQPLLSLYNPATLRVEAWVRESLAVDLDVGQFLSLSVPSVGTEANAQIEEIVPAADPGSRAFLVRLVLPLQGRLAPGMYARVDVPAGDDCSLRLPRRFLREVGQLNVIWVDGPAGVERRFVRIGRTIDSEVEVVSGLSAGETVVLPAAASNTTS